MSCSKELTRGHEVAAHGRRDALGPPAPRNHAKCANKILASLGKCKAGGGGGGSAHMWAMLAAVSGASNLGTGWVWMTFTAGEGTRASSVTPACWASSTFCARTTVCRRGTRTSLRLLLRAVEGALRSAATEDMLQWVRAKRAGRERW